MRILLIAACLLATTACEQRKGKITIPDAQVQAALALSAFECSHLAPNRGESSRLFQVGLQSGRQFLEFAEGNDNGYKSIAGKIDPAWNDATPRASADFKLGQLYGESLARTQLLRGDWDDEQWASRRGELFRMRNCQFIGATPAAERN